jgi:hypothetical protein
LWPWDDYNHLPWGSKRAVPRVQKAEKSRFDLLLLDFLIFPFVHPAQALLRSNPQLPARVRRVVAKGAQLACPRVGLLRALAGGECGL